MLTRWFRVFPCLLLAAACGSSETARLEHFEAGNRYLAEQKPAEAILEYRNALREDPRYGEARLKLAEAYALAGDSERAAREYIRAADLLPDNVDAQLKAATALLASRQYEDAQTRVQRVLDRNPSHVEALVIRGSALAGLNNIEGAVEQIEEAIKVDPDRGLTYTNLAFLQMAAGKRDQARASFEKAVELAPQSLPALLSLANFHWAAGELDLAQQTLDRALKVDGKNLLVNRALAMLSLGRGRAADAEPYLKTVAEVTPGPEGRFALADYYRSTQRPADARAILEPMAREARTFAGAQTRLATLEYAGGNAARGHSMLDAVLQKEPNDENALLLKAAWLLRENKGTDALKYATTAAKARPTSVSAHYMVGTVQASLYDNDGAVASFREVLKLNPRIAGAQVQLSRLELLRGNADDAVELASAAVQAAPAAPRARLMLARSLLAQRDVRRAEPAVSELLKEYPNVAPVHALNGTLQLAKADLPAARAAFARALDIDATSFDAFSGLVAADLMEKRVPAARARIDARLAEGARTLQLLLLAGRVYMTANDMPAAERVLRDAIAMAPAEGSSYRLLAQVYVAQGKLDLAQAEFERVAQRNPSDVGARLMAAIIVHSRDNIPEARKRYEEIVEARPDLALASNNLAWILAESGGDLDRAQRLAQSAVQQTPDNAEYNDTLGWVYMKRQLPLLAVPLFERAVASDPGNPTLQYHLGMALANSGSPDKARAALQKSLAMGVPFPDAPAAKKLLSTLN